jgi:glycogen phosphorylase
VEAEALYDLLERDVIPLFYDRGLDRLPRKWIEHMKASIGTICPFVNTHRMVKDYTCQVYLKAHERYGALEMDSSARAKALASWVSRVRQAWPHIRVDTVDRGSKSTLTIGSKVRVRAHVRLGSLSPQDVAVELYLGRLDPGGEIIQADLTPMEPADQDNQGNFLFEAVTSCPESGMHGFTVRVRPHHPDLSVPFLPGLICWARS